MTLQETAHPEAALESRRHRFTVADYYRMAEAGILGEGDRVELIEGEILDMSPIGPRHTACVKRIRRLLDGLGGRVVVGVQDPIRLGEYGEPEPDLTLLRPRDDLYASGHPTPGDILLVIEVADSSIEYDIRVKVPLYARNGISELWLVDLNEGHVVVYRDPIGDGYSTVRVARLGDTISPAALPELRGALADILG